MIVRFNFYDYSSYDWSTHRWHSWLRAKITTLFSRFVHCNVTIGTVTYDFSNHGAGVFLEPYPAKAAAVLCLEVAEAERFIFRFVERIESGSHALLWAQCGAGCLLPMANCSRVAGEIVNVRAGTPDRLYAEVLHLGGVSAQSD